jgi:hypothetical protein
MPSAPRSESEQTKQELEDFIRHAANLVLLEGGDPLLELAHHDWQVSLQFGKLLLEIWRPGRSLAWRVESIAYRDGGRLGLFVRKPRGREMTTLELRESSASVSLSRSDERARVRQTLLQSLQQHFPGWTFERVSNRSDREHSFSAWYTRGLAKRGKESWAFLGLGEQEAPAAADAALSFGLIWLDWLRRYREDLHIAGLKLFLPASAVLLAAHRTACLNSRAASVEIFEWPATEPRWAPIDLKDSGNVETRLAHRRRPDLWLRRTEDALRDTLSGWVERLEAVPDASGNTLSLRIFGLEVARLEGELAPRLAWGIENERREFRESDRAKFDEFMRRVIETRRAKSERKDHLYYRLQPERWLESLLIRDLSQLDPAIRARYAYSQVPAFSGGDRGVVDILSVTAGGRLVVIELKLHEEITLPVQGLDYWLRVKWLNDRRQFQPFGYFHGLELSPAAPILYLVSPAFRFHSTTRKILQFFDPSIEVVLVGLNQSWRDGVKVLFRTGAAISD